MTHRDPLLLKNFVIFSNTGLLMATEKCRYIGYFDLKPFLRRRRQRLWESWIQNLRSRIDIYNGHIE